MMAVPGVVLLIPKFLVLKQFGLYDSYVGLILPVIVDATGVFIMKQAFESVPVAVEEAARIDGAGIFRTYWSVVLPMMRPALITLGILSFQNAWNEFPHTLVAVQSPQYFTLPRGLADLVSGSLGAGTQYPLKLGAALLATIPVAVIFFIFQRYFVRGANEGSDQGLTADRDTRQGTAGVVGDLWLGRWAVWVGATVGSGSGGWRSPPAPTGSAPASRRARRVTVAAGTRTPDGPGLGVGSPPSTSLSPTGTPGPTVSV